MVARLERLISMKTKKILNSIAIMKEVYTRDTLNTTHVDLCKRYEVSPHLLPEILFQRHKSSSQPFFEMSRKINRGGVA